MRDAQNNGKLSNFLTEIKKNKTFKRDDTLMTSIAIVAVVIFGTCQKFKKIYHNALRNHLRREETRFSCYVTSLILLSRFIDVSKKSFKFCTNP